MSCANLHVDFGHLSSASILDLQINSRVLSQAELSRRAKMLEIRYERHSSETEADVDNKVPFLASSCV